MGRLQRLATCKVGLTKPTCGAEAGMV